MGGSVEEYGVSARADAEVPDVGASQGAGAAHRRRPYRLVWGHVHVADGDRDAEGHAGGEAGSWIAVSGQGDRHASVQEPPGVRVGRPGGEFGGGQQGGDSAAGRQRVHVGVVEVGGMVGRRRAELHRDLHAGARPELVGVEPRLQSPLYPGRQDRPGLVAVEGAPFTEHVDPFRLGRARVEHCRANQLK